MAFPSGNERLASPRDLSTEVGRTVGVMQRKHNASDRLFHILTGASAGLSFLIILGLFVKLIDDSWLSLRTFGLSFLFSQTWDPVAHEFGALSSIFGTLVSTGIALLFAIPMSIVIALFLVEIAHPLVAKPIGYAIELLAAIPSIIYGMWGLFAFAPFMSRHIEPFLQNHLGFLPLFAGPPMGIGMLTAGIILAFMILPFVSAVMRDVFLLVPEILKEAGYGMGATTWEMTSHITIRYGISGLIGATFLGLGRALGETMAVTFVIGNEHAIHSSIFSPGNSIASTLANEFTEASDPLYLSSLIELGLILLILTILI
jgi:phosphate transport system permease protein